MVIAEEPAAARIATRAGAALMELRQRLGAGDADGAALGAQGDRLSHDLIMAELAAAFPADPVLSEEGKDQTERLKSRRVWIVDPLDGTREFGEPGRTDWAVHVALVVDGTPAVAAVALPGRDLTLTTAAPVALRPRHDAPPRVVVSRTRPPAVALALANALGAQLLEMGSAGAKAMAVVLGDADVYVHAGGQYEWDSAAPVGVAAAAGLHVSRIDGSPLRYNQQSPWLPDLLICRRELASEALRFLASA